MTRSTWPFASLLATAALAVAGPALAQGACKTTGSAKAHAVALPDGGPPDVEFNRALSQATAPQTLALADKGARCTRSAAPALKGENGDPAPRVWHDGTHAAYLAPVPLKGPGGSAIVYALVKVWGSGAVRVDALYNAIPTDKALVAAMKEGWASGGYDSLGFDPKTGKLIDASDYLIRQLADAAAAKP